jgi:hypothetical protein
MKMSIVNARASADNNNLGSLSHGVLAHSVSATPTLSQDDTEGTFLNLRGCQSGKL